MITLFIQTTRLLCVTMPFFFAVASATRISVADMLKSKSTAHLLAYHSEMRATILKFAAN